MILVGLGSSLAFCGVEPQDLLRLAMRAISTIAPVAERSRLYRSPAWPDPGDPPFVNAVLALVCAPPPDALLESLVRIEDAFGRRRGRKNAPRTLDLDLLAYDREIRAEGPLLLPHPGIARRDFVLAPLCDIAPDWVCPLSGRSAQAMLAALKTVTATPVSA